jgi:RNA polymerase sigma-70 factor, ECF subfamily
MDAGTRRCAGLCTSEGLAAAYRAHHRMLRHRARLVLGDADLAEDAVQEAFLRAWRACERFDARRPERLGAWLTAITRNVAIDMARSRALRPAPSPMPAEDAAPVHGDPADTLVDRTVLREALDRISADQRTAILATVVHGHRYGSVAAALDVPEGTVKTRVFHGLRRMRGELAAPEVGRERVPA